MSSLDDALDRPEFEVLDLNIGVDEAHQYVDDAVKGLTTAESPEGRKYRTHDGRLVAILGDRSTDSGERKAALARRTAPLSASATRKARKIQDALAAHVVD
jgi:hypothetical protein